MQFVDPSLVPELTHEPWETLTILRLALWPVRFNVGIGEERDPIAVLAVSSVSLIRMPGGIHYPLPIKVLDIILVKPVRNAVRITKGGCVSILALSNKPCPKLPKTVI
jgi:hypothetical protein